MADQLKTSTSIATKWALISFAFGVVLTYVYEFTNVEQESPLRYLSILPSIAFILLAQKEYRDELGGYITFGKAFSTGFRVAVFAGLLTAIFVFVYTKYLSPEVFEQSLAKSEEKLITDQGMSQAQAEKTIDVMRKYGHIIGSFGAAIGSAVFGAIISLIGAAILKKERSPYDTDETEVVTTDPTV